MVTQSFSIFLKTGVCLLFLPATLPAEVQNSACVQAIVEFQSTAERYDKAIQAAETQTKDYKAACSRVYGKYSYTEQECGSGSRRISAYTQAVAEIARQEEYFIRAKEIVINSCTVKDWPRIQ